MPVSNSSPLIHLARLGKLRFAKSCFASVIIPPAVRRETIAEGKDGGYEVSQLEGLEKGGWLVTTKLGPDSVRLANELTETLGTGEAEAIALAREKEERLFMDDRMGRRVAEFHGVSTSTTLGLMLEMLEGKVLNLTEYEKNVKEYGSMGWISSDVIQLFLSRGRELG
jgi:uncharacterized protein